MVGFQEIKTLNGGCSALLSTEVVVFYSQNSRSASYFYGRYRKLVGKCHEDLDLLMFT